MLLSAIVSMAGCSNEVLDVLKQYTLAVTNTFGVSGQPETGSYTYNENEVVNYAFTPSAGYKNVTVLLDEVVVATSGTFPMIANRTLKTSAQRILYMKKNWSCNFKWTSGDCVFENSSNIPAKGTQDGDNITLAFRSVPVGLGNLTITLTGSITPTGTFLLVGQSSVTDNGRTYIYLVNIIGSMNGENRFKGTITVKINPGQAFSCTKEGTITATPS